MHLHLRTVLPLTVAILGSPGNGVAEEGPVELPAEAARFRWHSRVGLGISPAFSSQEQLPVLHRGYNASLAGFLQLSKRFSTGVGLDWDRYTYDSSNSEDAPGSAPRYRDKVLSHVRVLGLIQWNALTGYAATPYLVAGVGYGWKRAEVTAWQCEPRNPSGLVASAGAGLDLAVSDTIGLGVEYRISAPPIAGVSCTGALIFDEPRGAPAGFPLQRIALTVRLRL